MEVIESGGADGVIFSNDIDIAVFAMLVDEGSVGIIGNTEGLEEIVPIDGVEISDGFLDILGILDVIGGIGTIVQVFEGIDDVSDIGIHSMYSFVKLNLYLSL